MSVETLWTVDQIAERLNVHSQTVQRWLKRGEMQGAKIGRAWLVKESALEAFLDKHLNTQVA